MYCNIMMMVYYCGSRLICKNPSNSVKDRAILLYCTPNESLEYSLSANIF